MSRNKCSTFYLFKQRGSYLTGAATIFNIWGNFFDYEYSKSGIEADRKALENDWGAVGRDFNKVMENTSPSKVKKMANV